MQVGFIMQTEGLKYSFSSEKHINIAQICTKCVKKGVKKFAKEVSRNLHLRRARTLIRTIPSSSSLRFDEAKRIAFNLCVGRLYSKRDA